MSKLPLKCKQLNIQVLKFQENLINQFSAAILLKNTTKPFSQTKDIHWCYHQLHQTSGVSLASCLTSYIPRLGSQRKRLQYSFLARKQFVRSPKHWHLIYFGWFWEKTNESGSCRFLYLAQSSPIKVLAQTKVFWTGRKSKKNTRNERKYRDTLLMVGCSTYRHQNQIVNMFNFPRKHYQKHNGPRVLTL